MSEQFKDHFSRDSKGYRDFRPSYSVDLFSFLSSLSEHHDLAWDCATGSGQAAVMLADHYSQVIGTDASKCQIANAKAKEGVRYEVAKAEQSGIAQNSVDIITVAQALHWFNIGAFANEARRVLKPGGLLAVWSYQLFSIDEAIDECVNGLYHNTLEGYWPEERKMVENGYSEVTFPFELVEDVPVFEMTEDWTLPQVCGYLASWSAVGKYRQATGLDPIQALYPKLLAQWGNENQPKTVAWPLVLKLWRK